MNTEAQTETFSRVEMVQLHCLIGARLYRLQEDRAGDGDDMTAQSNRNYMRELRALMGKLDRMIDAATE